MSSSGFELVKVSQRSPQVIIDPEAPLAILAATEKYSPSARGRDFKAVLLIAFGIPNGRSRNVATTTRGMVCITTLKEKG